MGKRLPKINEKQSINQLGISILTKITSQNFLLIEHPTDKDYGIDFSVEYINSNRTPSGIFNFIQLKSH